jgi:hypothetical protein
MVAAASTAPGCARMPICGAGIKSQPSLDNDAALKGAGIDTIIRYYDWVEETLPGKTLIRRERDLIAKAGLSLAVIFQHHNDCLRVLMAAFMVSREGATSIADAPTCAATPSWLPSPESCGLRWTTKRGRQATAQAEKPAKPSTKLRTIPLPRYPCVVVLKIAGRRRASMTY